YFNGLLGRLTGESLRVSIDGAEYWLSPLTLADWATIECRIVETRKDPIETAKERLAGLDDSEKRMLLDAALREATRTAGVTARELLAYTTTRAGFELLFWLAIRKRHPTIDEPQAAHLVARIAGDAIVEV